MAGEGAIGRGTRQRLSLKLKIIFNSYRLMSDMIGGADKVS